MNMNINKKLYYHCYECVDEEFGSVDQLEVHIAKEHYNFYPFKCENCNIKFSTKWEIQRHSTRFHKADDFICSPEMITFKTLEIEKKIKKLFDKSINSSKSNTIFNNTTENNINNDVEKFSRKRRLIEIASERLEDNMIKVENDSDEVTIIEPSLNEFVVLKEDAVELMKMKNTNTEKAHRNDSENISKKQTEAILPKMKNNNKKLVDEDVDSDKFFLNNEEVQKNYKEKEIVIDENDNTNDGSKSIICPDCNQLVSSKKINVYGHISNHHVKKTMFQCKFCEFNSVSVRRDKVSRHAKKHKMSVDECMVDFRPKHYPLVIKKAVELFGENMNRKCPY